MNAVLVACSLVMQLPGEDASLQLSGEFGLSAPGRQVTYVGSVYEEATPPPSPVPAAACDPAPYGYSMMQPSDCFAGDGSDHWCHHHSGCECGHIKTKHGVKPAGDMHQHYPYTAYPQMYYYLRPYQAVQVRELAQQAVMLGANPKAPYSNALFRDVYKEVEAQFAPPQPME